jgi:limonene-1,2-epoxide hydrolase
VPDHRQTLEALIDAWRQKDLAAVLDFVSDDLVYHFHVGTRPIVGKDAFEKFLKRLGEQQQEVGWRIVRHAQAGDVLFVEGFDDYVDRKGRRIRHPYAGVFEFQGGRIRRWRDHFDLGLLQRLQAGESLPDWLEDLVTADSADV